MLHAVTVRYTRIIPDEFHYYNWLTSLPANQRVVRMQLERKHGLHLHALIENDSLNLMYVKRRGVHVLTEPIYDAKGWLRYILKDHPDSIEKDEYIENYKISNALKTYRIL